MALCACVEDASLAQYVPFLVLLYLQRPESTKHAPMLMDACASAWEMLVSFYSGMCADHLLVKRVGWLNVLHHPHPMLLLIERATANEPRTPQFTRWLMTFLCLYLRLWVPYI